MADTLIASSAPYTGRVLVRTLFASGTPVEGRVKGTLIASRNDNEFYIALVPSTYYCSSSFLFSVHFTTKYQVIRLRRGLMRAPDYSVKITNLYIYMRLYKYSEQISNSTKPRRVDLDCYGTSCLTELLGGAVVNARTGKRNRFSGTMLLPYIANGNVDEDEEYVFLQYNLATAWVPIEGVVAADIPLSALLPRLTRPQLATVARMHGIYVGGRHANKGRIVEELMAHKCSQCSIFYTVLSRVDKAKTDKERQQDVRDRLSEEKEIAKPVIDSSFPPKPLTEELMVETIRGFSEEVLVKISTQKTL